MKSGEEVKTADFDSLGRDLFWRYRDSQDGTIRWTGYDDANWWQNVAPANRDRKGPVTGRTYRIDYETDVVQVVP